MLDSETQNLQTCHMLAQRFNIMSTRLFFSRPSAVTLSPTGLVSAYPLEDKDSLVMAVVKLKNSTTEDARVNDNSWLDGYRLRSFVPMGRESVCPSTCMRQPG